MSGLQDRIDAAANLRASEVPATPESAGFDLLANPFILLGVPTSASAQAIKEAYEDALEEGVASAEVLARAQQCLLSPKLRVDAEVGGLLGVDPGLASRVVAKLRSGAGRATLTDEIRELDALPRSNLSAHLGARGPGLDAMLDLLHAQAATVAGRVVEAIGAAREAAGAAKADPATIELALAQLAEQQARAVVYASSGDATFATILATLVERTLAGPDAAAIDRLDLYLRVYGQASASELSRRRENVMVACEAQRQNAANRTAAEQIVGALVSWAEIVRPLQLYEAYRNRDDAASREVWQQIRNLYISVCDESRQFDIAQHLSTACVDIFKHVPGALGQAREDCAAIEWAGFNDDLKQAFAARDGDKAIALIDWMLKRKPDAENERRLRETRAKIVAGRTEAQIKYGAGTIAVAFVVALAVARLTSTSSSNLPRYVRPAPSYQVASPSLSTPWSPSLRDPRIFAPWPGSGAYRSGSYDNGAEEKPAIGAVTGSRGNLRYCAFQGARLSTMQPLAQTQVDEDEVSLLVKDWRARCAQMRGNPDDQQVIDREVSAARVRLGAEGLTMFKRWQADRASGRTNDGIEQ